MRTDVVIDQYRVRLPNAPMIGYARITAGVGDIVVFSEAGHTTYGRVIGRVHHAPSLEETPEIKDWLLVAALGHNLSFLMERWVDPAVVTECFNPQNCGRDMVKFMSFFFGSGWCSEKKEFLRGLVSGGWSDPDVYRDHLSQMEKRDRRL